jgi:hypothetical protein
MSPAAGRLASGFALALVVAFSAYLVIDATRTGGSWFTSLWFLALLPALLCGLIGVVGDPDLKRSGGFYLMVPPTLVVLVVFGSIAFLREGVICLMMISPIWLASGWLGAFLVRWQRRRGLKGGTLHSSFLVIPLVAALVEAQLPIPHESVVVSRSILVHATPAEIWPFAVSSRAIGPDEGRWTLTHDIVGVPRPRGSAVDRPGVGAVRTAWWGEHIRFEERITEWSPGRRLGWRFAFSDASLQHYTDEHISPDGRFLKIDSGGYTIRQVAPGLTRLTLDTRYIAMTHVNLYARLWGELFLGDIQDNVLTIIRDRAEKGHART